MSPKEKHFQCIFYMVGVSLFDFFVWCDIRYKYQCVHESFDHRVNTQASTLPPPLGRIMLVLTSGVDSKDSMYARNVW